MNTTFYSYEIKRILKARFTRIVILVSSLFPLLASLLSPYVNEEFYGIILGINSSTLLSQAILVPAKAGALFSTFAFISLTLFEFDKIERYQVDLLISPISSPMTTIFSKLFGIWTAGLLVTVGSMIILLPYYLLQVRSMINFTYYIFCMFFIIFGAIIMASLMTAGFYLIFCHVNVTCIIMSLAILFSFLAGIINYQYMWVQTGASGLSDSFGYGTIFPGILWNRLFGIAVSMAIFLFGILCNRCYGKNLLSSFCKNCMKYCFLFILFLLTTVCAFILFHQEPLFKSISLMDFTQILITGDKETPVNTNIRSTSDRVISFTIDVNNHSASGSFEEELENLQEAPQIVYIELAAGYKIDSLLFDDKDLTYTLVSPSQMNSAKLKNVYAITIPKKVKAILSVEYSGIPKQLNVNNDFSAGISKDYVCLRRASDVFPVVCTCQQNSSIEGKIWIDKDFTVIIPGKKNEIVDEKDHLLCWNFSYPNKEDFTLTAGRYGVFERTVDETNVEFFYPLDAREKFESRGQDTLDIFTFFSNKFGPLGTDSLKVVVTSGVFGGSGSQSGNISFLAEDCLKESKSNAFTQASSSDSFALLTHEIAHTWWGTGILISNASSENPDDEGHEEWTSDAFADFSAYLFLKEKFGEDYGNQMFVSKWKSTSSELFRNFYYRNPAYINQLSAFPKYYVSLTLRGDKQYGLGPLTVYQVYQQLGKQNFDAVVKNIYQDYYGQSGKAFALSDFYRITGISKEVSFHE